MPSDNLGRKQANLTRVLRALFKNVQPTVRKNIKPVHDERALSNLNLNYEERIKRANPLKSLVNVKYETAL